MADIYSKEREKRQLELDKLYYQINPHFLMNALNSAQWQALMDDSPDIANYLSKLNYILGYTLGKVTQNATIRTELQVLTAYLELQQTRQDFQVWTEIEEGLYLDRSCARLILQPIAENAVCHSINDFGNLWVSARELDGNRVEIVIRDDGTGFDATLMSFKEPPEAGTERQKNVGIGLRYVWLTMDAFYEGKADMQIASRRGEGTTVTIILPQLEES